MGGNTVVRPSFDDGIAGKIYAWAADRGVAVIVVAEGSLVRISIPPCKARYVFPKMTAEDRDDGYVSGRLDRFMAECKRDGSGLR